VRDVDKTLVPGKGNKVFYFPPNSAKRTTCIVRMPTSNARLCWDGLSCVNG
jgi:hypothetical protein